MTAAQHGIWTGTEPRRLLAERAGLEPSAATMSALFTQQPSQVKLTTLAALCAALDCTPGDPLTLHDPHRTLNPSAAPRPHPDPAAFQQQPAPRRSLPPL